MKKIFCLAVFTALTIQCFPQKKQTKSAGTKRFETIWKNGDSRNEFQSTFKFSRSYGLGFQENVSRRDPSTVIKVDDTYYVWYTRSWGDRPIEPENSTEKCYDEASPRIRGSSWDYGCIGYATSKDGFNWTEQGKAVCPGPPGSFDSRSLFAPDVMLINGKFYLYYSACATRDENPTVIGMSWADSPDGPWRRVDEPLLEPVKGAKNQYCHDPNLLYWKGKYWIYYKGGVAAGSNIPRHSWGVAIADQPEGPFVHSKLNPISNSGEDVFAWPYKEGIALLVTRLGPEKNTIQYATDGLNFKIKGNHVYPPDGSGAYIPDKYSNTSFGDGFTWGISHVKPAVGHPEAYLVRFDCDLSQSIDWPRDQRGRTLVKNFWTPNPGCLYMHEGNRLNVKDRLRPEDRNK